MKAKKGPAPKGAGRIAYEKKLNLLVNFIQWCDVFFRT
jgi:hypothetical protein